MSERTNLQMTNKLFFWLKFLRIEWRSSLDLPEGLIRVGESMLELLISKVLIACSSTDREAKL